MFIIDSIDRIARISLDRPQARNAIAIQHWTMLSAAIAQVAASDAHVLIVRSMAPNIFCSGADIGDLEALGTDPAMRTRFRTEMAAAFDALARLPIATIAAIEGGCYGAGVALALACDIRIAGPKASFGITPAKVGIVYPAGDVARLKALVGPGQAARLLTTGMTIDADQALAIGLVEERSAAADQGALDLAATIAANSRSSVAGLKRILAADPAADALFEDAFGGHDFLEGVAAFRERRRPVFGG
ncbi:enoyl-CoA hydratase/isomerase family protein [Sphingomonas sp. SRS2]|uniref:enoyl-CoA hydratase/isomerase family protein n=1 Tax=Sphingomonas sp. SRS2 TaxID=133190 RepID=UPI0006184059|nr:enoyl-CoA hydratase/isomerase family protein [Sphingomonas sp. SRS2]KKC27498.1 enoyl-CoA hydratase [Sphingomonas sp. SRS2]